jgi:hypothetical protein
VREALEKLITSEQRSDPVELFRIKAMVEYAWTRAAKAA